LPGNHGAGLIRVYPDLESLSKAAAALFVREAGSAISARGRFSVALSGGGTPGRTYELLAGAPYREQVDWAGVHVFWGDERCVPWDDPRNNARAAYLALLSRVPLPGDQIHPLDCTGNPEAGARRYEALLREFFGGGPPRLDLVFLGLGENGHTASLFPHTPVLKEQERWAAAVYVAEQDIYRVTLTAPLLNQAARLVFLVAGAAKAGVLQEVRQGAPDPERLPAQLIGPVSGELLWLVDQAAAGQRP
jgi:6-phosphogluconolactonase